MSNDQHAIDAVGGQSVSLSLAMLRNSPDCVKLLNSEGRISFMSENGLCAMEIAQATDVVGKAWWALWPEASRTGLETAFSQAMGGKESQFAGMCPTAAGTEKFWDVRLTPVVNDDQTVTSVLAVSREVAKPAV